MIVGEHRGGLVIFLSLCLALLLTTLPLPEWARPYRPQWVTLILLYWAIALPHRVGVGTAFVVGLTQDALTGTLLGQHALGLSVVTFIAVQSHRRLRLFPLWQQALVILSLLFVEHLLSLLVIGATSGRTPALEYWAVPFVGALLWPWLFIVLRDLRRRFHVQ